jgi:hypothetical protein
MRAEANKFQAVVIRLAVEKNKIGLDVAVAVILPFTEQWVIEIPARQRCVGGEQVDEGPSVARPTSCCAGRIFLACNRAENG